MFIAVHFQKYPPLQADTLSLFRLETYKTLLNRSHSFKVWYKVRAAVVNKTSYTETSIAIALVMKRLVLE